MIVCPDPSVCGCVSPARARDVRECLSWSVSPSLSVCVCVRQGTGPTGKGTGNRAARLSGRQRVQPGPRLSVSWVRAVEVGAATRGRSGQATASGRSSLPFCLELHKYRSPFRAIPLPGASCGPPRGAEPWRRLVASGRWVFFNFPPFLPFFGFPFLGFGFRVRGLKRFRV
jgi:hypothetical protein